MKLEDVQIGSNIYTNDKEQRCGRVEAIVDDKIRIYYYATDQTTLVYPGDMNAQLQPLNNDDDEEESHEI